jgi:hypothetical protein
MHSILAIDWKKPSVEGAAWFAQVEGVDVGYVSQTAFEDARWNSVVIRGVESELRCYAGSEAQAMYFVERYLSHHMPDVKALAAARKAWREGGSLPRKPKGLEDRS